jgi:hypothetical protein
MLYENHRSLEMDRKVNPWIQVKHWREDEDFSDLHDSRQQGGG